MGLYKSRLEYGAVLYSIEIRNRNHYTFFYDEIITKCDPTIIFLNNAGAQDFEPLRFLKK